MVSTNSDLTDGPRLVKYYLSDSFHDEKHNGANVSTSSGCHPNLALEPTDFSLWSQDREALALLQELSDKYPELRAFATQLPGGTVETIYVEEGDHKQSDNAFEVNTCLIAPPCVLTEAHEERKSPKRILLCGLQPSTTVSFSKDPQSIRKKDAEAEMTVLPREAHPRKDPSCTTIPTPPTPKITHLLPASLFVSKRSLGVSTDHVSEAVRHHAADKQINTLPAPQTNEDTRSTQMHEQTESALTEWRRGQKLRETWRQEPSLPEHLHRVADLEGNGLVRLRRIIIVMRVREYLDWTEEEVIQTCAWLAKTRNGREDNPPNEKNRELVGVLPPTPDWDAKDAATRGSGTQIIIEERDSEFFLSSGATFALLRALLFL